MESDNKQLVPVSADGRDGNGNLLPAVRETALEQIDSYITSNKAVNISELARGLGLSWNTVAPMVNEVMERWKKQDAYKIQRYRKQLVDMASSLINSNAGEMTMDKMRDFITLYQEMVAVLRLEDGEEVRQGDESRIITVHFNDMRMTPAMMEDIERNKNPRKIIEQTPLAEHKVVEVQPVIVEVAATPIEPTPETVKENPFLKNDGNNNATGHPGDSA